MESRWTTVTESSFEHERRGLEAIRTRLPDVDPWLAWSNFTFTAATGHIREVDLLVVAPNGVHLVELKDWSGRLYSRNGDWVQERQRGGTLYHRSPLHLANQKSKELAGLLASHGVRVFVGNAVCLTNPGLRSNRSISSRTVWVFARSPSGSSNRRPGLVRHTALPTKTRTPWDARSPASSLLF